MGKRLVTLLLVAAWCAAACAYGFDLPAGELRTETSGEWGWWYTESRSYTNYDNVRATPDSISVKKSKSHPDIYWNDNAIFDKDGKLLRTMLSDISIKTTYKTIEAPRLEENNAGRERVSVMEAMGYSRPKRATSPQTIRVDSIIGLGLSDYKLGIEMDTIRQMLFRMPYEADKAVPGKFTTAVAYDIEALIAKKNEFYGDLMWDKIVAKNMAKICGVPLSAVNTDDKRRAFMRKQRSKSLAAARAAAEKEVKILYASVAQSKALGYETHHPCEAASEYVERLKKQSYAAEYRCKRTGDNTFLLTFKHEVSDGEENVYRIAPVAIELEFFAEAPMKLGHRIKYILHPEGAGAVADDK